MHLHFNSKSQHCEFTLSLQSEMQLENQVDDAKKVFPVH